MLELCLRLEAIYLFLPHLPARAETVAVQERTVATATVVLPCWNEERSVRPLFETFKQVFADNPPQSIRLLFVDDGSTDRTWQEVEGLPDTSGPLQICSVRLRSHFGKTAAQAIGLQWAVAQGGPVVFMDSDGQHHPHALLDPLTRCSTSGKTQIARRAEYQRTTISKMGTAGLQLLAKLIGVPFRPDLAEYVVISEETASRLATSSQLRTIPLLPLVQSVSNGFETFCVVVTERLDGTTQTRWSNSALWQKAVLHLLTNPWALFLRLSIVISGAILLMGGYGLYVGLTSMFNGTFLGVGSILVAVVITFAMLGMIQIATLALVILLLKRLDVSPGAVYDPESERPSE